MFSNMCPTAMNFSHCTSSSILLKISTISFLSGFSFSERNIIYSLTAFLIIAFILLQNQKFIYLNKNFQNKKKKQYMFFYKFFLS